MEKDQWWGNAQPSDIATVHAVATRWKDHDPAALRALLARFAVSDGAFRVVGSVGLRSHRFLLRGNGGSTRSAGQAGKSSVLKVFPGSINARWPPLRRPIVRLGCRDYDGRMNRRLAALIGVPFVVIMAGCGQVQDAAKSIASDAASQAATAAADVVRGQICSPLQDGQLGAQDKQVLSGLLSAARAAGVPAQFVTPLEEIAKAGEQVPGASVTALLQACGITPSPAPTGK